MALYIWDCNLGFLFSWQLERTSLCFFNLTRWLYFVSLLRTVHFCSILTYNFLSLSFMVTSSSLHLQTLPSFLTFNHYFFSQRGMSSFVDVSETFANSLWTFALPGVAGPLLYHILSMIRYFSWFSFWFLSSGWCR